MEITVNGTLCPPGSCVCSVVGEIIFLKITPSAEVIERHIVATIHRNTNICIRCEQNRMSIKYVDRTHVLTMASRIPVEATLELNPAHAVTACAYVRLCTSRLYSRQLLARYQSPSNPTEIIKKLNRADFRFPSRLHRDTKR